MDKSRAGRDNTPVKVTKTRKIAFSRRKSQGMGRCED